MKHKKHTGRRPGNNQSRNMISEVAKKQFATMGYDKTSMRGIAKEANVDPALVTHFFGSKQQLFLSVTKLPVDIADIKNGLLKAPKQDIPQLLALQLVELLESNDSRDTMLGLIKATITEPVASKLLREQIIADLLLPVVEQLDVTKPEQRTALLCSTLVGIQVSRYIASVEPLASMPKDKLVDVIAKNVNFILFE